MASATGVQKKDSGFLSKLSDGAGSAFKSICSVDRKIDETFENPHIRSMVRIALDVAIIAIGVIAFYYMSGGVDIAHPTLFKIMSMPMTLGIAGLGMSRLIQNNIPKKYHRTATKIATMLAPFGLLAGSGLIIASSWNMGYCATSITGYTLAGCLILPLSCYLFDKIRTEMGKKRAIVVEEPAQEERHVSRRERARMRNRKRPPGTHGFDKV